MMKRWIKLPLFIAILLMASIIVLIVHNHNYAPYKTDQELLAESLGVRVDDYPYPNVFPQGYFQSVLTQKLSVQEVHDLVVGYEKVFVCGGNIEIYYYFSDSDKEALRFKINYNNDNALESLQGEDEDSRYLDPIGCVEGRVGEK